jgi:anti-sigma B factor antagonist
VPETPVVKPVPPPYGQRAPTDISSPLFSVAERRVGQRAVVSVAGEVDISTAEELRTAIETAAGGASEVWVDLSETTFMDSSGVHAMIRARADMADANLRLTLICPDGPVLRVLELTNLDRLFEIHANRSDANHAAA